MSAIAATHAGSLPHTQTVVDFISARERNEACDPAAFDAAMTEAVNEIARRRVEAGVDIVSDGETSKISYATDLKDRYSGFSGDSPRTAPADLKRFPPSSNGLSVKVVRRNMGGPCAPVRCGSKTRANSRRTSAT